MIRRNDKNKTTQSQVEGFAVIKAKYRKKEHEDAAD